MYDKDNIIKEKSYNFALRIIKLYKYLNTEKKEFVLSKQILRCGTSIGANIEEAIGAISKKDFLNKMYIAHKESRETSYWIRLLRDSDFIEKKFSESILVDCEEILKITGKIISSTNKNLKENN
jgi:four helix bundle protein